MNSRDELFRDVLEKEIKCGFYDIKIDDISIYHFIKRGVRTDVMLTNGIEIGGKSLSKSVWDYRKNIIKSFCQIFCLILSRKHYDNFIYAFYRTEKIKGKYIEKFTDPIIDYSNIKKSYIIFESDRSGSHLQPRYHQDKVIFADAITFLANKTASYKLWKKNKKYEEKWNELKLKLENTFPAAKINYSLYKKVILAELYKTKFYQYLFKRLKVKTFISPARACFIPLIPAAKLQGVKVYELQHGVIYSEHRTNSGYMDPMFTPDKFLVYGDVDNPQFYGVPKQDIINIGWCFGKYLDYYKPLKSDDEKKVLVISSGVFLNTQEQLLTALFFLAESNANVQFYYRPHPEEIITKKQKEEISKHNNITLDDNKENLMVVISQFDCIIGCNSAGLYDAIDMQKKVGKIEMEGLQPMFIKQGDEQFFYHITDNKSFNIFLDSPIEAKPKRTYYTSFKEDVLNNLVSQ